MNVLLALIIALLAATSVYAQTKIDVRISVTDPSIMPEILITAPNGDRRTLVQSEVIDATAGTYRFTTISKHKPNPIADEVYGDSEKTLRIEQKDTTYLVNIRYEKFKGTGMIWVPNRQNQLIGLDHQALTDRNSEPAIIIDTPTEPFLIAIDTTFNIWYWDNEHLHKINNADIKSGPVKTAMKLPISAVSYSLFNANSMHIDQMNRLWFGLNYDQQLLYFNINRLTNDLDAAPDGILKLDMYITDFAFSPNMDFVAYAAMGDFAVARMPSTLPTNAQTVQLSPSSKSVELGSFSSLDFDSKGNLWVASQGTGIFRYDASTLSNGQIGNDSHSLEIDTPDYSYWGLKIDNSDQLWVMPRWDDYAIGIDVFDQRAIQGRSRPTFSYIFPRYVEHGKFLINTKSKRN